MRLQREDGAAGNRDIYARATADSASLSEPSARSRDGSAQRRGQRRRGQEYRAYYKLGSTRILPALCQGSTVASSLASRLLAVIQTTAAQPSAAAAYQVSDILKQIAPTSPTLPWPFPGKPASRRRGHLDWRTMLGLSRRSRDDAESRRRRLHRAGGRCSSRSYFFAMNREASSWDSVTWRWRSSGSQNVWFRDGLAAASHVSQRQHRSSPTAGTIIYSGLVVARYRRRLERGGDVRAHVAH